MRRFLTLVAVAGCHGKPPPKPPPGPTYPLAHAWPAPTQLAVLARQIRQEPLLPAPPSVARPSLLPALAGPAPTPQQLAAWKRIADASTGGDRVAAFERLALALEHDLDANLDAAAAAYGTLVTELALDKHKRGDELLLRGARVLLRAGRHDDPIRALTRLVTSFPASRYLADAYNELADASQDFAEQRQYFTRAIAAPASRAVDYARYKLAWTDLQVDAPQRALAGFAEVVHSETADAELRAAALRSAPVAYAQLNRPDRARNFFADLDADHVDELVRATARRYHELGKLEDAIDLLADLAKYEQDPRLKCEDAVELLAARAIHGRHREVAYYAATAAVSASTGVPACVHDVDAIAADLAFAWSADLARDNPDYVLRMWTLVGDITDDAERKAAARRNAAYVAWKIAMPAASPQPWLDAAVYLRAAGETDGELDALDNALHIGRLVERQRERIRELLAAIPGARSHALAAIAR